MFESIAALVTHEDSNHERRTHRFARKAPPAPDLEGLEQLRLLNPAPAGVAVPTPQHASRPALISVDQKPGTIGTAVGVARGGDEFISGGGYAPGAAAAFTAAGAQAGFAAVNAAADSGGASSGFVNSSVSHTRER